MPLFVWLVALLFAPNRNAAPIATQSATLVQPADSILRRAQLELRVSEFHALWQHFWQVSETARTGSRLGNVTARLRLGYLHCHPDAMQATTAANVVMLTNDISVRPFPQYPQLLSDSSSFAACPTWLLADTVAAAADESVQRDGALLPEFRSALGAARSALLRRLDSAAVVAPGDGWVSGQRVRLRADAGNLPAAAQSAADCRTQGWWCAALQGYVAAKQGRMVAAESSFVAMEAAMDPVTRCAWSNIAMILPTATRAEYDKQTCAARAVSNANYWWLADPMYRTAGNQRLVVQQMRRVDVALRRAVGSDERYPWKVARGGDAMARLIERYGWPTYTAWGGYDVDFSHSHYLAGRTSAEVLPYTTFEYTNDRQRFSAEWRAVLAPFDAREEDWRLFGEDSTGRSIEARWPSEHMQVRRVTVPLRDGQTVVLRRQTQLVVTSAYDLRDSTLGEPGAAFDAMLMRSARPGYADSLAQRVATVGSTLVMQGMVPPEPALLSLELVGVGGTRVDARTRFGMQPVPPLSAMRAGDVAMSAPALIDVPTSFSVVTAPADSILDHLLGSAMLRGGARRVGVFWESYGIAAGDTVTVTLRVARDEERSVTRRLGMALGVADDPNRPIEIRWTEPDPQHATRTLVGPVPVQQRFLVLNLGSLAVGVYAVSIRMERRGSPAMERRTRLTVMP